MHGILGLFAMGLHRTGGIFSSGQRHRQHRSSASAPRRMKAASGFRVGGSRVGLRGRKNTGGRETLAQYRKRAAFENMVVATQIQGMRQRVAAARNGSVGLVTAPGRKLMKPRRGIESFSNAQGYGHTIVSKSYAQELASSTGKTHWYLKSFKNGKAKFGRALPAVVQSRINKLASQRAQRRHRASGKMKVRGSGPVTVKAHTRHSSKGKMVRVKQTTRKRGRR